MNRRERFGGECYTRGARVSAYKHGVIDQVAALVKVVTDPWVRLHVCAPDSAVSRTSTVLLRQLKHIITSVDAIRICGYSAGQIQKNQMSTSGHLQA